VLHADKLDARHTLDILEMPVQSQDRTAVFFRQHRDIAIRQVDGPALFLEGIGKLPGIEALEA
jgi:hypothetical protein